MPLPGCAYPKGVYRRLQMGADDGWDVAIAIKMSKCLGHQNEGRGSSVNRVRAAIDDSALHTEFPKHVRDFPPIGGDTYSIDRR